MNFKLYIDYKSYLSLYIWSDFMEHSLFQFSNLHYDGTTALQFCLFSNFHFAELQQLIQKGAMSVRIFVAFKGCTGAQ